MQRIYEVVRRGAALACLVGAYQTVVTYFAPGWMILSIVSAVIVARGPVHWALPAIDPPPLPWPHGPMWWRLLPGWALMVANVGATLIGLPPLVSLLLWLSGLTWLLWGAWRLSTERGAQPPPPSMWRWGLVVLAVAAALRLWEIDTVPRYVHSDEGAVILMGLDQFKQSPYDWFGAAAAGMATSMNLCFAMGTLGSWIGGFNLTAARMPDVILGILSVLFLMDGLRRVSSMPVAVAGALLLAANHSHVAFSRIASAFIQTAFVVSVLFAVFARVWTSPTYLNSVVLGVVGALGVQTYGASMAAVPLVLGVMFLLALWYPRRRRAAVVPFVLFVLSGAATGAPAALTLLRQHQGVFVRSNDINIFTPAKMEQLKREVYHTDSAAQVVAHQAWNSLRGFYLPLNAQPQYGSLIYGMADPYTAALMIPGAVFALCAVSEFVAINALAFTVGYLLLGLGMQWAPGFNRTTGALPLGMVLSAIAAVQCCATLWGNGTWGRWARDASLAAVVTLCIVTNVWIYFVHNGMVRAYGDDVSESAWVARHYASEYTVHLVEWQEPGSEGLRLILGSLTDSVRSRVHLFPHDADKLAHLATIEPSGADLFVIDLNDSAARDAVLRRFPQARTETWRRDPSVGPAFYLLFVGQPRAAVAG